MSTVAVSSVKNEADVIEAFVRHTLAHVDRLLVVDNGSTDATREILEQLRAEGLALELSEDTSLGHHQSVRINKLMRTAFDAHGAAWVVPLDADEFIQSNAPLREILATQAQELRHWVWRHFVPTAHDDAREPNLLLRVRHYVANYPAHWKKVIVPHSIGRLTQATLEQGNHGVMLDGSPMPSTALADAHLAHYPARSAEQYASKSVIGQLQYMSRPTWDGRQGFHRRRPFDAVRSSYLAFQSTLTDLAAGFALTDDEVRALVPALCDAPSSYVGSPLRYTRAPDIDSLLTNLVEFSRALAEKLSETERTLTGERAAAERALAETLSGAERALAEAERASAERFSEAERAWAEKLSASADTIATLRQSLAIEDQKRARLEEELSLLREQVSSRTVQLVQRAQSLVRRIGVDPTKLGALIYGKRRKR